MDNIPQMNPNEFLQAIFDIQATNQPQVPVVGQDTDYTLIAG